MTTHARSYIQRSQQCGHKGKDLTNVVNPTVPADVRRRRKPVSALLLNADLALHKREADVCQVLRNSNNRFFVNFNNRVLSGSPQGTRWILPSSGISWCAALSVHIQSHSLECRVSSEGLMIFRLVHCSLFETNNLLHESLPGTDDDKQFLGPRFKFLQCLPWSLSCSL